MESEKIQMENGKIQVENETSPALKRSRFMYICEAALEYLIAILVSGSFLATLTKSLGMSDSLTGVLSSVISLGCLFQLLSAVYRRQQVKRFVIILSVFNQLLFMLLYVIPLAGGGKQLKIVAFTVVIILAYLLYNIAHPKKISWLMALVEDGHRGRFTANKEIVSLVIGMAFSFSMGVVVDYFSGRNEIRTAFALSGGVIFVLMILHTVTMALAVERTAEHTETVESGEPVERRGFRENLQDVLNNKNVVKISMVFVLYNITTYLAMPFYGTYQIHELGFSLKLVSAFTMLGSIVRILVSRFWGSYADKRSFAEMVEKCLLILGVGYLCAAFAVPANGRILFAGYYICHGVAQGGINSALINLIFDYVTPDKRADSLAICQAGAGIAGFLTTLAVSPLVSAIQQNGNTLWGLPIYAQQVLSAAALIITVLTVVFVRRRVILPEK